MQQGKNQARIDPGATTAIRPDTLGIDAGNFMASLLIRRRSRELLNQREKVRLSRLHPPNHSLILSLKIN